MLGVFAGRGDVIVALGLAFIVGMWAGYKLRQLVEFIKRQ